MLNQAQQIAERNTTENVPQPVLAPTQICKFEELKGEFYVRREIGRGKFIRFVKLASKVLTELFLKLPEQMTTMLIRMERSGSMLSKESFQL